MRAWGLRTKSILALLLACLIALVPTGLIGWRVLDGIRDYYGSAYARSSVKLLKEEVFARVARELALSQRLARSEITRSWLRDEDNPAKRALFFREAESFRSDFHDHSYSVVSHRYYYFNGDNLPFSESPRARLDPKDPQFAWFYNTMRDTEQFNLNTDYDKAVDQTKVWINVIVYDGDKKLGVAGTGLDLTRFLRDFVARPDPGLTPMILDANGAIQIHPERQLIALNSGTQKEGEAASTIFRLLGGPADEAALRQAMRAVSSFQGELRILNVRLSGRPQLLALAYMPELKWYMVSAVDLQTVQLIQPVWLWALLGMGLVLFTALVLGFLYVVDRLLLQPILALRSSAQAIAAGNYTVRVPVTGGDELGELGRAFDTMARTVASHTEQLEQRVSERTAALEEANKRMLAAHKQIDDSIDYASLIQRAVLPERELAQALGPHHFVLWWPRDVVGGDFYVFRRDGDNCLLGVVDCAGHGVPGALMTMLGGAAIDQAINVAGPSSPAAVLAQADVAVRAMLREGELRKALATSMDAGLCYLDRGARRMLFAGAKISLYWSDGAQVEELKGSRRALGDRRVGDYQDLSLELQPERTYYLVTDGVLDQAGGEHGFGFGSSRLAEMLLQHARLPLEEQAARFSDIINAYRGAYPQRDDITILSFRFDDTAFTGQNHD
ncbi:biofilm regulation protein phosphatase SiaA [Massilia sp. TS11]|uniref:biofilm regulation protein phosphatase SiaA n=1 Tax=Massilia sp. TS11 TaxID=2908003 RepID=UPI001EDA8822|nr:biofilm regulation protein phosphatase SiaA [Massilia sp. TS11]MCG2586887.1 biofilm regulation protein phosphatase SiaA [Massilia sp. TS11]